MFQNKIQFYCFCWLIIIINIFVISYLNAEQWEIGENTTNKWKSCILENCSIISQQHKKRYIRLDLNENQPDNKTDLLLNFNNKKINDLKDHSLNYRIREVKYYQNPNISIFNSLAAGFVYLDDKVVLEIGKKNWLGNTIDCESFTIDFWIYPTCNNDYDTIFERIDYSGNVPRGLKIYFLKRKLVWEFRNFFFNYRDDFFTFTLNNGNNIIIDKWHHVGITFNRTTGRLSKWHNGFEDEVHYATVSRNPEDTILIPKFQYSEGADAILGKNFFGYIDEFRISTDSRKGFRISNYRAEDGIVISPVFDTEYTGTKVIDLKNSSTISENSEIKYYFRSSNKLFPKLSTYPAWKLFSPGIYGRYIQWKAVLKTLDNGFTTPEFYGINLIYEKDIPPDPPIGVKLESKNKVFIIAWNRNTEIDIGGYYVHYGHNPDRFIRKFNVGMKNSYTIKGLRAGIRYYFAISAYDKAKPVHESYLSEIVTGLLTQERTNE